jgi:hypothetical protein
VRSSCCCWVPRFGPGSRPPVLLPAAAPSTAAVPVALLSAAFPAAAAACMHAPSWCPTTARVTRQGVQAPVAALCLSFLAWLCPGLVCDLLSGWLAHQRSSPSRAVLALRAVCRALRAGGVYASADAARVGGGLYQALVEALCTLATDPSPRVAAAGLAALRSAAVELVPVPAAAAAAGLAGSRATLPAPSRTPLVTGGGNSGALPVGTPAASGGPGAFLAGSR